VPHLDEDNEGGKKEEKVKQGKEEEVTQEKEAEEDEARIAEVFCRVKPLLERLNM
jgi:hypothetical protein